MAADVRIPQLGESVSEGVIVSWLKDDGALVRADEPLLELETEKATMEIPAETSGRLRITRPAGARVAVGDVVGRIEVAPASTPVPAPPPSDRPAAAVSTAGSGEVPTPAPSAVPTPAAVPTQVVPPTPIATTPRPAPNDGGGNGGRAAEPDVERVPMSELRRAIARRLVDAQRTAAKIGRAHV